MSFKYSLKYENIVVPRGHDIFIARNFFSPRMSAELEYVLCMICEKNVTLAKIECENNC